VNPYPKLDCWLGALLNAGIDLDPIEIADAFWLARVISGPNRDDQGAGTTTPPREEPDLPTPRTSDATEPLPERDTAARERAAPSPPAEYRVLTQAEPGAAAQPIVIPDAPALYHKLEISRALRPLRRRVESYRTEELDEVATAHRMAIVRYSWPEAPLIPVLRPGRTRWLELVMIVDRSQTMAVWRRTLDELCTLVYQLGAFEHVRVVYMQADPNAPDRVLTATRAEAEAWPVFQGTEIGTHGRSLVMVVSDCIGPLWTSGGMNQFLKQQAKYGPLVVLQVLAPHLWRRTSLAGLEPVLLRATAPCAPPHRLQIESEDDALPHDEADPRFVVPVVPLLAGSLAAWSHLVAGHPAGLAAGFWFEPRLADRSSEPPSVASQEPEIEALVERFIRVSSTTARKLAAYLAAVPLTMPVIRYVRMLFVPEAREDHLVEVLFSGLLLQRRPDLWTIADEAEAYDFRPGARELLLSGLGSPTIEHVARRIGAELGATHGADHDFSAFLISAKDALASEARPFATVTRVLATVLRPVRGTSPDSTSIRDALVKEGASHTSSNTVGSEAIPVVKRSDRSPSGHRATPTEGAMDSVGVAGPTYHVLLIGIDNYPGRELRGSVNDIDAVQRMLLDDRLAIPPTCIWRLASPLPGTRHETAVAEQPATLANIRAALTELGSDRVQPGDRVFIYYSGHGKRVVVTGSDGATFEREALVPVDFEATSGLDRFLFDFEFNALLAAIAARTSSVTVMLDCAHAAGVLRHGDTVRSFDRGARDREPIADPAGQLAATRGRGSDDMTGSVSTCQVVSACHANELCREIDRDGVRTGLFTTAFVAAVRGTTGDLRALTWDRIWHSVRSEVTLCNPAQNPRMSGSLRRAVFGGPPVDGDAGLYVSRDGDSYRIAAGTMADITRDTELAIYGPDPARLPPLGSTADLAVRLGVVLVVTAESASAYAAAIGPAFELPAGARGRVMKAGVASRLRCAVTPPDAYLAAEIVRSPVLELVDSDQPAPVRLVRRGFRWYVTDDQHGTGDDAPVLYAVEADDALGARAVLEHYVRYSLPLRFAARATGLPGGLELRVLRCPDDRRIPPAEAQGLNLSEAPVQDGRYRVPADGAICVVVRNRTPTDLQVTLLNVASSGRVQLLGEASVSSGLSYVFWASGQLGVAFRMHLGISADRSRDRLVALGRTMLAHDLGYLRVTETFEEIGDLPVTETLEQIDAQESIDDGSARTASLKGWTATRLATAPLEGWTAAQVVVETVRT
jgi:hypothetical protein